LVSGHQVALDPLVSGPIPKKFFGHLFCLVWKTQLTPTFSPLSL
jgi:hypothetical protein